ncbi:MAG: UTRA domain-containing protein, partial [Mesorhizobium sp.]
MDRLAVHRDIDGDRDQHDGARLQLEIGKIVRIAEALSIARGSAVIRLETRGEADGHPVSRATTWFDAKRFAGIET